MVDKELLTKVDPRPTMTKATIGASITRSEPIGGAGKFGAPASNKPLSPRATPGRSPLFRK